MRILTLTQPWATLVAIGAKRIETRSWSTKYRGLVAIHAAKGFPIQCLALCGEEPFSTALRDELAKDALPRSQILAIADLVDCVSTNVKNETLSYRERSFGDYSPNRFAWKLANVRRLEVPFAFKGALGLRSLPDEIARKLAPKPDAPA